MLEKFLEKYLNYCKARNLSRGTLVMYENSIKQFDSYLIKNGLEADLDGAEAYFSNRSDFVAQNTLRGEFVAISIFFNYCVKRGFMTDNPLDLMKKPKAGKHSIRVFSQKEIEQIFNCCDLETFVGKRNHTIFSLMLSTGCRVSEICGIKIDDIDWQNNWIIVRGKGDKIRFVPMANSLRKSLKKYLIARKTYIHDHYLPIRDNLFITRTGAELNKDMVNNHFVQIKRKIKARGARFSSHTFRHTFATLYLKNGGDLISLQKILGHNKLETTRLYLNFSQDDVQTQMMRYNPIDNQNWKYL